MRYRYAFGLIAALILIAMLALPSTAREQAEKRLAIPLGENIPATGNVEKAQITIIWFADYLAPQSRNSSALFKTLMDEYPDKLRIYVRQAPQPYHQFGTKLAKAALAAHQQGKFWPFHRALNAAKPPINDATITQAAKGALLDMAKFEKDRVSPQIEGLLTDDLAVAREAGGITAPWFSVNGKRVVGLQDADQWRELIERLLDEAKRYDERGDALYAKIITLGKTIRPAPARAEHPAAAAARPAGQANTDAIPIGDSPTKGAANAPVTIVVFTEFQCPFCAAVVETIDKVVEHYGSNVQVVFKHFPMSFHTYAKQASVAALAAGKQGKFWEMHDMLFKNQHVLTEKAIMGYASALGLNMEQFAADFNAPENEDRVMQDVELGRTLGVRGTPTFFINGELLMGAQPYKNFAAMIDKHLKAVQR